MLVQERPDVVVVGLGYVGLPVAVEAAKAGLCVVGFDVRADIVAALNEGCSHVGDISDDELRDALRGGFAPTTDPAHMSGASAIIICVPTPLNHDGIPDLSAIEAAAASVAAHLSPGALVVLESTTYPGTTQDVLRPILETSGLVAGSDFHLAYSPERIDPGNPEFGLRNTPKIVGGLTPNCTAAASTLYGKFVDEIVRAKGPREAELAKLIENTYRHVNIALVNEMAVFCHELGVDLWDAIGLASTKPFGFQAFYPGPGVGGHCIPIDPNYLSYTVRKAGMPFRFVELAQEINAGMPAYLEQRISRLLNGQGKAVKGANILLLGVTYKPDVGDQRESPAIPLAKRLRELSAHLSYHDPYVSEWRPGGEPLRSVPDLEAAVRDADLVVVLQAHSSYDLDAVALSARCVLDTRGRMTGAVVERL